MIEAISGAGSGHSVVPWSSLPGAEGTGKSDFGLVLNSQIMSSAMAAWMSMIQSHSPAATEQAAATAAVSAVNAAPAAPQTPPTPQVAPPAPVAPAEPAYVMPTAAYMNILSMRNG